MKIYGVFERGRLGPNACVICIGTEPTDLIVSYLTSSTCRHTHVIV